MRPTEPNRRTATKRKETEIIMNYDVIMVVCINAKPNEEEE